MCLQRLSDQLNNSLEFNRNAVTGFRVCYPMNTSLLPHEYGSVTPSVAP